MTNREWAQSAIKELEVIFAEYEKQIRTNERNMLREKLNIEIPPWDMESD